MFSNVVVKSVSSCGVSCVPCSLWVDHHWKIRARKQRTDIGKYSFVNRSITDWNQLPEGAIGTSRGKTPIFKTRVREVQNSGGSEGDKN